MPKIYKAENARETLSKDLGIHMNRTAGPTKVIQPNLFLVVDVDEMQKQVNRLENRINHMHRVESKRRWFQGRKKRG